MFFDDLQWGFLQQVFMETDKVLENYVHPAILHFVGHCDQSLEHVEENFFEIQILASCGNKNC